MTGRKGCESWRIASLQDHAMGAAMDATGTTGYFNQAQALTGKAQRFTNMAHRIKVRLLFPSSVTPNFSESPGSWSSHH